MHVHTLKPLLLHGCVYYLVIVFSLFFVCVCMHIFNAFSDFYANMLSLKLLHATKLFLLLGIARHSAEYVNLC